MTKEELERIWRDEPLGYLTKLRVKQKKTKKYRIMLMPRYEKSFGSFDVEIESDAVKDSVGWKHHAELKQKVREYLSGHPQATQEHLDNFTFSYSVKIL